MIITLPSKIKPIKEEFYGTSSYIEEALNALSKIVNQLRKKSKLEIINFNPTDSKENEIISKAFCKEFGFAKMEINWSNETIPNAYTIIGGSFVNTRPGNKLAKKKKTDKYYDKDHKYACFMVIVNNLIYNCELNPRETMGIMLHEIGHNFDNQTCTILNETILSILSFGVRDIIKYLYTYVEKGKAFLRKEAPEVMYCIDLITSLPYHLSIINLPSPTMLYSLSPDYLIQLMIGTKMEYYADSFAAKYGFGPDLASALSKLDQRKKSAGYVQRNIAKVPGLRTLHDLAAGPCEMILQLIDVHPAAENRLLAIKNNLKKDYSDPEVPAKFKPEIKRQIDMCDKYIEIDKKNAETDGLLFSAVKKMIMYNNLVSDWWTK